MDATSLELLRELEQAGRVHDAREPAHDQRFLNLEPDTARLLTVLIGWLAETIAGWRRR